ncbi:MAG: zinc ribbon domain-containing protein [Blastocatellia bacterium]
MGYREISQQLEQVLYLITELPSLRNDPADSTGTIRLFDGGRVIVITGSTRYEFADGTIASVGTQPGSPLVVTFPDGWEVSIRLRRRVCYRCGELLRSTAKFCPVCGARAARVGTQPSVGDPTSDL